MVNGPQVVFTRVFQISVHKAFIFPVLVWLSLLVASGSGIMCGLQLSHRERQSCDVVL